VFHAPNSLRVARAFSDPPMNLMTATRQDGGVRLSDGTGAAPAFAPPVASASLTCGRARQCAARAGQRPGDVEVQGVVELAEISGSDTFVHVPTRPGASWWPSSPGCITLNWAHRCRLHLNPAQAYVFGADEALVLAPQRAGGR
jgi:glycerol transport system ATP-binding protein